MEVVGSPTPWGWWLGEGPELGLGAAVGLAECWLAGLWVGGLDYFTIFDELLEDFASHFAGEWADVVGWAPLLYLVPGGGAEFLEGVFYLLGVLFLIEAGVFLGFAEVFFAHALEGFFWGEWLVAHFGLSFRLWLGLFPLPDIFIKHLGAIVVKRGGSAGVKDGKSVTAI